jgi:hypothetical protein
MFVSYSPLDFHLISKSHIRTYGIVGRNGRHRSIDVSNITISNCSVDSSRRLPREQAHRDGKVDAKFREAVVQVWSNSSWGKHLTLDCPSLPILQRKKNANLDRSCFSWAPGWRGDDRLGTAACRTEISSVRTVLLGGGLKNRPEGAAPEGLVRASRRGDVFIMKRPRERLLSGSKMLSVSAFMCFMLVIAGATS